MKRWRLLVRSFWAMCSLHEARKPVLAYATTTPTAGAGDYSAHRPLQSIVHTTLLGASIVAAVWSLFLLVQPRAQSLQPNTPTPAVLAAFTTQQGLPDINAIFSLVNQQRQAANLAPLQRDAALTAIAQQRAADMQANRYYAHQSPNGSYFYDLAKQAGTPLAYGCENLDMQATLQPDTYVQDWQRSSRHQACMLHASATRAGYEVVPFSPTQSTDGSPLYIVVAIHATP